MKNSMMQLLAMTCLLYASQVRAGLTLYGTGDPATSGGLTITGGSGDSAYVITDSIYVEPGAFLDTWGPAATGDAVIGGDGTISLPVELTSFSAAVTAGGVQLAWTTATEQDNLGFNILRSSGPDGAFIRVNGTLIPGNGTGSAEQRYSFTDTAPPAGELSYALEAVDINGGIQRYDAVMVTTAPAGLATVSSPVLNGNGLPGGVVRVGDITALAGNTAARVRLLNVGGTVVWQGGDGITALMAAAGTAAVFVLERNTAGSVEHSLVVITGAD